MNVKTFQINFCAQSVERYLGNFIKIVHVFKNVFEKLFICPLLRPIVFGKSFVPQKLRSEKNEEIILFSNETID